MLQRRESVSSVPVPDLGADISIYVQAGIGIPIKVGLLRTLKEVEDLTQQEVLQMYQELSGDKRLTVGLYSARRVIAGDLQLAWYRAMGKDIPPQVMSSQEERMAKAKTATAETEQAQGEAKAAGEKKPRVTIRSIIENGLLAGTSNDEILAQVKAKKPDAKADEKHIAYYRHYLQKDGKLEKLPKAPRPEKAPKTSEAAIKEAAAGNGTAEAAPTKVKAGPAGRRQLAAQAAGKGGKK